MPLFSIITVCYNAEGTIERTLQSVASQSFTDYEHIIVDGASRDSTLEIVKRYPHAKVVSEPDRGIYDAMNKGQSRAKGKYLIFLNAGDKFHCADTLRTIADAIEKNDTPSIVYGQTDIVDNDGNRLGPRHLTAPDNLMLTSFAQGMLVCHQAFVVLARIADFYDLKYRYSADFDWCIKCLINSYQNVGLTDTVLIDYLSEGVTTENRMASLIERFRIMSFYYGFYPTLLRHFGFISRWFKRKLQKK